MVSGRRDDQHRHHEMHHSDPTPAARARSERSERDDRRPCHVQRRHRGELRRHSGPGLAVHVDPVDHRDVDVAEFGEVPRWRDLDEADEQTERRQDRECIAPVRVGVAVPGVEPHEEDDDAGDVRNGVVVGREPGEPVVVEHEELQRQFARQPEELLHGDDVVGAIDRTVGLGQRQVLGHAPDRVERRDERELECGRPGDLTEPRRSRPPQDQRDETGNRRGNRRLTPRRPLHGCSACLPGARTAIPRRSQR